MATSPTIAGRGRTGVALAGGAVAIAAAGVGYMLYQPAAERPQPGVAPPAVTAPAPPPPPPPWTADQLGDLAAAAERADAEGLRASDYAADALRRAVAEHRTGADVDRLAAGAALDLAHDYAAGRVRGRHRFNWYIDYQGADQAGLAAAIVEARQGGRLGAWLTGLLPTAPDYAALKAALADTPADDWWRRDRIKANLERWRWLPRDFGHGDTLYVNLPTYRLQVRHDGETLETYRAVIGATDMPTPALSAAVRRVFVNPDWIVPASIVRKSHIRPGGRYEFSARPGGGVRVRLKPGPGNPLGKVKIELPNALAIYFHDTPSKGLFSADARTFSHGCVRVQNIAALAGSLVADRDRYDAAMAGAQTRSFAPVHPLRADIVYLTLVGDEATDGLRDVGDPYRMDEALAAAIEGRKPRAAPAAPAAIPADSPPPLPATPAEDPDDRSVAAAARPSPAPVPVPVPVLPLRLPLDATIPGSQPPADNHLQ